MPKTSTTLSTILAEMEKEFDEKIKPFIRSEIAKARDETIERVMEALPEKKKIERGVDENLEDYYAHEGFNQCLYETIDAIKSLGT